MVNYSIKDEPEKSSKAKGSHLRVHFKHMREVAHNIKGMKLAKAKAFLEDVLQFKQAVTFTKFTGGIGHHAQSLPKNWAKQGALFSHFDNQPQGKLRKAPGNKCRWPQKATKIVLDLLKNAEANAEVKGLDIESLVVTHIQTNRAPKQRRRTYRAHGRINPYMSSPAHIELLLAEEGSNVAKGEEEEGKQLKLSRKQAARRRVTVGGGVSA
ncbi:unnamed protein product [Heterosigma akashiwo]